MNSQAVFAALLAALSWGSGDFAGGLASKRSSPLSVTLVSNPIGLGLLVLFALWRAAPAPSAHDAAFGFAAGMCGAVGLLAFYSALASGKMGVVAPITAVLANTTALVFGALTEGFPQALQAFGFVLATLGVWVISKPQAQVEFNWREWRPAVVAGVAFGAFFILSGQYQDSDIAWTIAVARCGTILVVALAALLSRHRFGLEPRALPLAMLAGFTDSLGNFFFSLATQLGRLDVGAAISSLYPVITVALAMLVLRERLSRQQQLGALMSLVSLPLIAL